METAPTSIEVFFRPTLGQSDEPSDLHDSIWRGGLVDRHNEILDRYNGMVDRFNGLVDRYKEILYHFNDIPLYRYTRPS